MALTLSKTGITNGSTIEVGHVTQSVDAFTKQAAYDITLSGSLTLTGSVSSQNGFTGSLVGNASTSTSTSGFTGYYAPSGSLVAVAGILKFFAGASKTGTSAPYTAVVTVAPIDLTGKTLNQNLFLGVAPSQSGATVSATLNSPTSVTFVSNVASVDFTFVATYI
jgi:hypothetical protein